MSCSEHPRRLLTMQKTDTNPDRLDGGDGSDREESSGGFYPGSSPHDER